MTLSEAMLVAIKVIGSLFFGAVGVFTIVGVAIHLTDKIKNDNIRIPVRIFCVFMFIFISLTLLIYYSPESK